MQEDSTKPFRTAGELHAELDWAAHVLSGDDSDSPIIFELPTPAASSDSEAIYNWDVRVSCRPEQDEAAQAAVQYVADKWNLVITKADPDQDGMGTVQITSSDTTMNSA